MDKVDAERTAAIRDDLANRDRGMRISCNTLEDLKGVLAIIASVREGHMQMELNYLDLEERYRTRQLFGITMNEQEVKDAYTIRNVWAELHEVETIDDGLRGFARALHRGNRQAGEGFLGGLLQYA